jgi:hypothetical protein
MIEDRFLLGLLFLLMAGIGGASLVIFLYWFFDGRKTKKRKTS